MIPCFEQGRFLEAAVRSAREQLPQPDEIIVVDDGGAEDLAKILAPFSGVRILRQDNRGLAAARNLGLANAGSDKIIFLDADDRLLSGAISAGLECFGDHPSAAFVYGGFEEISGGRTEVRFKLMHDRRDLLRCNWVAMIGTAMFDRRKLLVMGGFDETLGMCEDWDAYLRLSRDHGFACHPPDRGPLPEARSEHVGRRPAASPLDRRGPFKGIAAWAEAVGVGTVASGSAYPRLLLRHAAQALGL